MGTVDITQFGFTREELQERVVEQICDRVLNEGWFEIDPQSVLKEKIKMQIDTAVEQLAEKHLLPNVQKIIEELTIQQTNEWGEAKGQPFSFIEYLLDRAKFYMQEMVDKNGRHKGHPDTTCYWRGEQTRITFLINSHLQYHIEDAMKGALKVANGEIAKGLHETVRIKLNEIVNSMNGKA